MTIYREEGRARKPLPELDEYSLDALNDAGIPDYMQGGIIRYVNKGVLPGHFLTAIITNDLQEAVARADVTNEKLLANYVRWFYNHAPSMCWGSQENYDNWIAMREREAA